MNGTPAVGRRPGWPTQLGPLAAIAVAAALRLRDLGARPVWTDEGSTWTAATLSVTDLLHRCVTRDASPPLFYLVTAGVLRLGDDEWHLRLFPALASVVLVWLTYRLARLGLPRGAATFAAFLAALSPFQLQYAQEARTYVPVAMFMVGAMVVYARVQQSPGPQRWLPLVLLTAAGLWTQSIGALGAVAQAAIAVLTPAGRRRFRPWAGAMAVAGVLYLPWLVYSRKMAEHLGHSHWYIPEASPHAVFNILRSALLSPFPLVTAPRSSTHPGLGEFMPPALAYGLLALPPLLALALSAPAVREHGPRGFVARIAWIGWLVPLLLVIAASLERSLLLPRYFVFLGPYLSVLLALGVAAVRPAPGRVALGACLVALSFLGLFRYDRDFVKEPWRQVAAHIRETSPPGRTAVLVPFDADPLVYYLRDDRSRVRPIEVHHAEQPFSARFTPRQLGEAVASARLESRGYDVVWTIVRSAGNEDRRELADRTVAVAAEGRVLAEDRAWPSYNAPLFVKRFDRAAAAPAGGRPAGAVDARTRP